MEGTGYESDRLLAEYLLFHYGRPGEILPWAGGPREALGYAERCVTELLDPAPLRGGRARALDLGCAVGRSTFELARFAPEVLGIDYSRKFISAARQVAAGGLDYRHTIEGDRTAASRAEPPPGVDPARVSFETGDATDLRPDLGSFDVVLAANLLCRLPDPARLLRRLPELVRPGGQLLLCTPFSWLEEFTPRDRWIGGREGQASEEALHQWLAPHFELQRAVDLPFLIREHARKFQWSVAWGTRWQRRAER